MTCGTKACDDEATVRVFWPGQTGDHCGTHALALANLAEHMGFALTLQALFINPRPPRPPEAA